MARCVLLEKILPIAISFCALVSTSANGQVTLEQQYRAEAKRIHERLTGVPPSLAVLQEMEQLISDDDGVAAAQYAIDNSMDDFLSTTIAQWAAPWTNRDQDVFVPFNDYMATIVAYAKAGGDFRGILYENKIGFLEGDSDAPPYDRLFADNPDSVTDHYEYIENTGQIPNVTLVDQDTHNGLPPAATAGVITSHAGSKAFFINGTNRAVLRFTLVNHLCMDLEQLHDTSLPPDRIRQDVSRSPGGDSRVFVNTCVGCHSGMDPLVQAFAYYNYDNGDTDIDENQNRLVYNETPDDSVTGGRVDKKYWVNNTTFPTGYVTETDDWDNYWRGTANGYLGWNDFSAEGVSNTGGSGSGAKSLGIELAHSDQFARCQVEKVFKNVCLRDPLSSVDRAFVFGAGPDTLLSAFTNGYNIQSTFAVAANYCRAVPFSSELSGE